MEENNPYYMEVEGYEKTYYRSNTGRPGHDFGCHGSAHPRSSAGRFESQCQLWLRPERRRPQCQEPSDWRRRHLRLSNRWDIQYVNNYTKGDNDNKINENYLVGNYRFTPYLSAFAGGSYVKTETYNTTKSYGYQVGLKGQIPLAARWQGFASVGVGDDVNTYEVGVGYDITPNWDAT